MDKVLVSALMLFAECEEAARSSSLAERVDRAAGVATPDGPLSERREVPGSYRQVPEIALATVIPQS